MPPDYRDPTKPEEWLRRARGNLARARAGREQPEVRLAERVVACAGSLVGRKGGEGE
jgi:hypothetical protein